MQPPTNAKRIRRVIPLAVVGGALLALLTLVAASADAKFSKGAGASTAHFHSTGPAGMSIDGTTSDVAVSDDGTTVSVRVALGSLDTGIKLRNDHMRNKYLEVAKFPEAIVTVPRAALALPADGQSRTADVPATLTLHGVARPVTLHYVASDSHGTFAVKGSTTINMNDYGIVVPSYFGVTISPKVDIDVAFSAVDA